MSAMSITKQVKTMSYGVSDHTNAYKFRVDSTVSNVSKTLYVVSITGQMVTINT